MLNIETTEFTRTLGESIFLNDPLLSSSIIEVQIVEVQAEQIKLGVTAPRTISVHRLEVWEQVQQVGQKLEERAFD